MKHASSKAIFYAMTAAIALSACSSQTATSRYGDAHITSNSAAGAYYGSECGVSLQPCGYLVQTYQYQVPQYHVQTQCPEPCLPPEPAPLPPISLPPEPPVYVPPTPEPEPPVEIPPLPPVTVPPTIVVPQGRPGCPEGTIPGYGGVDCIPITIPRK